MLEVRLNPLAYKEQLTVKPLLRDRMQRTRQELALHLLSLKEQLPTETIETKLMRIILASRIGNRAQAPGAPAPQPGTAPSLFALTLMGARVLRAYVDMLRIVIASDENRLGRILSSGLATHPAFTQSGLATLVGVGPGAPTTSPILVDDLAELALMATPGFRLPNTQGDVVAFAAALLNYTSDGGLLSTTDRGASVLSPDTGIPLSSPVQAQQAAYAVTDAMVHEVLALRYLEFTLAVLKKGPSAETPLSTGPEVMKARVDRIINASSQLIGLLAATTQVVLKAHLHWLTHPWVVSAAKNSVAKQIADVVENVSVKGYTIAGVAGYPELESSSMIEGRVCDPWPPTAQEPLVDLPRRVAEENPLIRDLTPNAAIPTSAITTWVSRAWALAALHEQVHDMYRQVTQGVAVLPELSVPTVRSEPVTMMSGVPDTLPGYPVPPVLDEGTFWSVDATGLSALIDTWVAHTYSSVVRTVREAGVERVPTLVTGDPGPVLELGRIIPLMPLVDPFHFGRQRHPVSLQGLLQLWGLTPTNLQRWLEDNIPSAGAVAARALADHLRFVGVLSIHHNGASSSRSGVTIRPFGGHWYHSHLEPGPVMAPEAITLGRLHRVEVDGRHLLEDAVVHLTPFSHVPSTCRVELAPEALVARGIASQRNDLPIAEWLSGVPDQVERPIVKDLPIVGWAPLPAGVIDYVTVPFAGEATGRVTHAVGSSTIGPDFLRRTNAVVDATPTPFTATAFPTVAAPPRKYT